MDDDDNDFTFPTVATSAPAPEGPRHDDVPTAASLGGLPRPDDFAAPRASPFWPFAAPPACSTAPATVPLKEEEAPASASSTRGEAQQQQEEEERERATAADEEERMDRLWEGAGAAATAAVAATRSGGGHAEPEEQRRTAAAYDERMDLLWESFNEDLLLRRAACSKAAAATADHAGGVALPGLDPDWCLCHSPPSDAESEETSASSPARARYGCAPTMLRVSSRAGGAGQFCSSPRRRPGRGGGAAAGWALLLRLFRRLFAVDKPASSRRHGGIYVP
uniref:Uncharacterized protein n=1 Tax=Arundo donax TaxID=35708 RepID=A0A0A9D743_ARUDO